MVLTVLDAGLVISILDGSDVHHVAATVAVAAAELRAAHGTALRLPDALVIATALALGAARVTATAGRCPSLPVHVEAFVSSGG